MGSTCLECPFLPLLRSKGAPRWEDLGSAREPHPVSLRLKGDLLGKIGNPRRNSPVVDVVGQISLCAACVAPELGSVACRSRAQGSCFAAVASSKTGRKKQTAPPHGARRRLKE